MSIEMIEPADDAAETTAVVQTPEVRAIVALKSSKTEFDLRALVEKAKAITLVNSPAGREECHAQLMVLVRSRTTITKLAKDVRDDATKFSKAIIKEENRLIAITAAEETRLQALRDAWDEKVAAEKEAKAAAERARVLAITTRITEIRGYATLAQQCRTSTRIQELIDKLGAVELTGFEEFEQEAKDARAATMRAMEVAFDAKKADEDERARIKEQQEAEAERQRVQAEALAKQQAELEEQRRVLQAQADAQAAEAARIQQAAAELAAALAEPVSALVEESAANEPQAPVNTVLIATVSVAETVHSAPPAETTQETARHGTESTPVAIETVAASPAGTVVPLRRAASTRPSDARLIGVLALHYRVHESTVLAWLLDMDLNAASANLLSEFNTPKESA